MISASKSRPFSCHALVLVVVLLSLTPKALGETVVDFEELMDFSSSSEHGSFFNGNVNDRENSAGWLSGGVHFGNDYSPDFGGFWNGWAYSNVQDAITGTFENQYAAAPGQGHDGSSNYAVGFAGSAMYINVPEGQQLASLWAANTTYASASMRDGDAFAKKFGGTLGTDPDWFGVSIIGYSEPNLDGAQTGTQEVILADYRYSNSEQDYILEGWNFVDLTAVGDARSIGFRFRSTDVGDFGINTPTYLAIDSLRLVDRPIQPTLDGDFNSDGVLDVVDIDMLTDEVIAETHTATFDLNGDARVDGLDHQVWVVELRQTWFGDTDLDGQFTSEDIVKTFRVQPARFEADVRAKWSHGDWNGDGRFSTSDFVTAFADGGYENGLRVAAAVPEPTSHLLSLLGVGLIGYCRRAGKRLS